MPMEPYEISVIPFKQILDVYSDGCLKWGEKMWDILFRQDILLKGIDDRTYKHNILFNISLAIIYGDWLNTSIGVTSYFPESLENFIDQLPVNWDSGEIEMMARKYSIQSYDEDHIWDNSTKSIFMVIYGLKGYIFKSLLSYYRSDSKIHDTLVESITTEGAENESDSFPMNYSVYASYEYVLQHFGTA